MIGKIQTKYIILVAILSLIVVIRLLLPYWALWYITSRINKTPNYHVKIADLKLNLLQGEVALDSVSLWKRNMSTTDPIFKVDNINFSLQWSALLKGKIVEKIIVQRPIITILDISDNHKKKEEPKITEQSVKVFPSLSPLNINEIIVHDGIIYFRNDRSKKPFNLYIKKINVSVKNIQNLARQHQELSAVLNLTAQAMDSADLFINLKFNPAIKTPTFSLQASLKDLPLTQINPFLKEYTNIETKAGTFSVYLEAKADQSRITGYVKPFLKGLQIKEENKGNLAQKIYEGAISTAHNILKNPTQETTATKIQISGNIDDPEASMLSIIGNLLRHGFIDGLLPKIDNNIPSHNISLKSK